MKSSPLATLSKNIFLSVFVILLMFSLTSCVTKAKFETSSVVPAAQGTVKVKKDNNKNHAIHIEISNLAESERLTPSKKTYVVWLVSDQNETKNLGQFNSSSGTFSSKLKASFKTVTSNKPTKIFITAEDDATVQYPGGVVVLTTERF
jgi:predicted small lipoprotein YifL